MPLLRDLNEIVHTEPLELCPAKMLSVCIIGVMQRNEVDELGCMPFMWLMLSQGLCITLQNNTGGGEMES